MKLTYTDLKNQFLRNIGSPDSTDEHILADFKSNLAQRYQMVLAKTANFTTQTTKTASTVADQQYYSYPPGVANIENVVVTVGSVDYPLRVVNSQRHWSSLNAIEFQATAFPQFIFPRRDDFGIWPTPQDVYTITFNYHYRDRSLLIEDYTAETVSLTNGSTTLTGTSTVFASYMIGMWFTITETTKAGWGRWYRIASFNSTTSLTLENKWQDATVTDAMYRIGQCPEIPEEGHICLVDGVTADYYSGMKNDLESATWFNNKFWTGDGNNSKRDEGDTNIKGGVIGLINSYQDRNRSGLVTRGIRQAPADLKVWGQTLTE